MDIPGWLQQNISPTEAIGVITGIVCVWLTVRQNIWNWPIGIVNNIFFGILFIRGRLYADLLLQIVYIILGIYGWYEWLHGGPGSSTLPVTRTSRTTWGILAAIAVISTFLLASLITWSTRLMGAPPPSNVYWDSATTVLCLVAQWMLARKLLENWPVWIATNISYIALYYVKGLYLLSGLQIIFIILSIQGYRAWRASLARDAA